MSDDSTPTPTGSTETTEPADALMAYLREQRWFAGKGGTSELTGIQTLPWLEAEAGEPRVRIALVTVATDGRPQLYQVPVSHYPQMQERLGHAMICVVDDAETGEPSFVYDALQDRHAIAVLTRGFVTPGQVLEHRTLGEVALDADTPAAPISGEQSNSSLVLGDDLILKVFRKLDAGRNPDIEVHAALTEADAEGVAPLRGWITAHTDSGSYDLAMLQDFLRSGTDGWESARTSVRSLVMDPDLDPEHSELSGGDFASEAERLGAVTARLHSAMRATLPTGTWHAEELEQLRHRLTRRLDEAMQSAPQLTGHRDAIALVYAQLGEEVESLDVQRVHGDLHLGQTLRSVTGWVVLDFEGEPAKPLSERTALDSPLRDVAGMLRSFDYAAHSVVTPEQVEEEQDRAIIAWAHRNREAFLAGYAGAGGIALTSGSDAVLRAYELDKAVYEVVYETHNRPGWVGIPLAAVQRLVAEL
jgi:maltokinase